MGEKEVDKYAEGFKVGWEKGEKEFEDKVIEIIDSCKIYRNVFIQKRELVKKLEEAFPEK